jgi:hypothetical protein
MNLYTKRPLLIGGALLFGGCGDTQPITPALPDSGDGPAADTGNQQDAAPTMDTGSVADSGPLLDSGPLPADIGVSPTDTGTPPHDAGALPVPPNNGDRCTDRGDAFCARSRAQFFCTGTHWQLTDNFDCRPCDQGRGFTGYGTASCAANVGAACAHYHQAWCDENLQPSMVCTTTWSSIDQRDRWEDTCALDQQGYLVASPMATPGFIGLDRAGRTRQAGQSLRPR